MLIEVADRLLKKYKVQSWSFDKGYWSTDNKELLSLVVPEVVLPKIGKKTEQEKEEESSKSFKRIRNQHSAIESNINELENRGLGRCPDSGYERFKKYIGLGITSYNL